MRDNFRVYVDKEGQTPQLRHQKRGWCAKSHPYYVRYVNNRPVAFRGPIEIVATRSPVDHKLKIYDYSQNEFVIASTIARE